MKEERCNFALEQQCRLRGYGLIAGIDEAGRGPLAGPVCAAAVILQEDRIPDGLDDSKKLTEKKREALYDAILEKAISYGIGWASHREIDEINILNATFLAMNRAVNSMHLTPDFLLIDGNLARGFDDIPHACVVGGDAKSQSIAAASILAKVSRDRLMKQLDSFYPTYAFAAHKGYGSARHRQALRQYGPCPIHRNSFLHKILSGGKT